MKKLNSIVAICALVCIATVALAEEKWFLKTIEKSTNDLETYALDSAFATPKVLDSVYIFINEQLTTGAFTNLCTLSMARTTNSYAAATTVATSSQSVHMVAMTNINLKVIEGDVLFMTNSWLKTTTRLFFK
jgi:hypothetical protein